MFRVAGYNGTITVVDPLVTVDVQGFFLYVMVTAFVGAVGYFVYTTYFNKVRRGPTIMHHCLEVTDTSLFAYFSTRSVQSAVRRPRSSRAPRPPCAPNGLTSTTSASRSRARRAWVLNRRTRRCRAPLWP